MKKYVDVEALLNNLPDDLPYKAIVKRVLMQAPSADVEPTEEVNRLKHILGCYALQYGTVRDMDVVEVVRCVDCKWWECRADRIGIGKCQNPLNGLFSEYSDNEDYCSYGERRDSND